MRCLLMGGQACVFYGAAQFSRDLDLAIAPHQANVERLRAAMDELDARHVEVPELGLPVLARGHAVHFRCQREDVRGLRIDVMSAMRGLPSFEQLWDRRTVIEFDGVPVDMLSLPDLVAAKKTQRLKDWPMIQRLVERSYLAAKQPSEAEIRFWLAELRTPELLLEVAERFPEEAAGCERGAAKAALNGDLAEVEAALAAEEAAEREVDRIHWAPLKKEIEAFRRDRSRG
ncbi:MAG: hypothetical protein U0Q16_36010 [Bryobacteraceae bacterium]